MTAVLDRLERAGYARRVPDTEDRRRVLIEITSKAERAAVEIWGPIAAEWQQMIGRCTVDELRLMLEMMRAGNELEARHIERIRAESDQPPH